MNASLQGLSLRYLSGSPLCTLPRICFSEFILSFCSTHAIYFKSSYISPSILLKSGNFINFLTHPIVIHADTSKVGEKFALTLKITENGPISISECHFLNCSTKSHGGGLHIEAKSSQLSVENSFFERCISEMKGGAIYALVESFTNKFNCFAFCKCGKPNSCDGSTIYSWAESHIETMMISANQCPRIGDMCWYGMLCLVHGSLQSQNINLSSSEVEFIAGLAHIQPPVGGSKIKFYSVMNQRTGNSIGFIDMSFPGEHEFGNIINNSVSTGLYYLQNSTTMIGNFVFMRNTGDITYMSVGGRGHFNKCYFDCSDKKRGNGFGITYDCHFKVSNLTAIPMQMLNTRACIIEVPNLGKTKLNSEMWKNGATFFAWMALISASSTFLVRPSLIGRSIRSGQKHE